MAPEETNLDLLEAFSEDEIGECSSLRPARVREVRDVPSDVLSLVRRVRVGGMRLDVGRNVPVEIVEPCPSMPKSALPSSLSRPA